jgi:hypothetical protein
LKEPASDHPVNQTADDSQALQALHVMQELHMSLETIDVLLEAVVVSMPGIRFTNPSHPSCASEADTIESLMSLD